MSKYNWIFQSNDISTDILTQDEAIAAIAMVTFCGAHSLALVDIAFLADILSGFEVFEEHSDVKLLQILDKLMATAATEGVGALFNAANEIIADELTLDAFAAGVSVLIDKNIIAIPRVHKQLLKQLQISLELSDEEAEQVIEDVLTAFEEAWEEEEIDGVPSQPTLAVTSASINAEKVEMYLSPLGNFSVPIPVETEFGGKVQPDDSAIAFTDDQGLLLRIDYYQIPHEFNQQIIKCGREKYFQAILAQKYIPQVILENIPDSTIEYTEFCPEIFAGAYFIVLNLPGGSNLCQQSPQGVMHRLNAYRGLLAFDYHQFFYVIANQFSYVEGETIPDINLEAVMLKQEIWDFVKTIQFY